ncbi:hypothetical protein DPMN_163719 [Dreissena polymorpha]|uniref:Exportin-7/Ran-binding protein 17 TPR repeats domain-containing protein n=1 Tax=Dreissena polymorpha TaxID=45954 RepID=A0A9D4ETT7_DREPO|nr:hypothetical protein DPMN_163719 [Dreissena polymorpha]
MANTTKRDTSCRPAYSITNLKFWGRSEQIITKTLQLLSDLSVGYSSVRKLVKLEAVQFMLNSHTVRSSFVFVFMPPDRKIRGILFWACLSLYVSV